MNLFPAILTESLETAQEQLNLAQEMDGVSVVQIDVIDGRYVDNLTITPADFSELNFGELQCDVHLMTEEPLDYVFELKDLKDTVPVRAVLGQIERMSSQQHFLEEVQKHGWLPGVSLDIFTPIEEITSDSWNYLRAVQLMCIEAGAQGREFNPIVLEKVMELRTRMQVEDAIIEIMVDGGISDKEIAALKRAGVHSASIGSTLWRADDTLDTAQQLRSQMK